MRLLLTSLGLTNKSIRKALENLAGKPIAEMSVAYIPTAIHGTPDGGIYAWQDIQDQIAVGWKEVKLLELTAFPSLVEAHWLTQLQNVDVILVGGGNTPYLSYWMQKSGFAEALRPLLVKVVYVGISAGSMVVTSNININQQILAEQGVYEDDQFGDRAPKGFGSDATVGLVPFTLRPHLNATYFETGTTLEDMKDQAKKTDLTLYALDDQSAIQVENDVVTIISEGEWHIFGVNDRLEQK